MKIGKDLTKSDKEKISKHMGSILGEFMTNPKTKTVIDLILTAGFKGDDAHKVMAVFQLIERMREKWGR